MTSLPLNSRVGSRVWINGSIVDALEAMIAVSDRGFTLGDGIFETMLWTGTHVRFLANHMARFTTSAAELGFRLPAAIGDIEAGLGALGGDATGLAAALRLTLTRGSGPRGLLIPDDGVCTLIATIAPFQAATMPVSLITVPTTRHAGAPTSRFKTLSYIDNVIALEQARKGGADDAIMLGTTGHIACSSSANLIIRYKGASLTPSLDDGALAGIVRGQLLKAGLVQEAHLTPFQLSQCDCAVLTNALIGVRPVKAIDGRPFLTDNDWIRTLSNSLA